MSALSKDELKEMIRAAVKDGMVQESIIKALEKMNQPQPSTPTETTVDHACSCPDCYCGIIDKLNKTSDYACADCGLPLGNERFAKQIDKCPNCGGTNTRKVERY